MMKTLKQPVPTDEGLKCPYCKSKFTEQVDGIDAEEYSDIHAVHFKCEDCKRVFRGWAMNMIVRIETEPFTKRGTSLLGGAQ